MKLYFIVNIVAITFAIAVSDSHGSAIVPTAAPQSGQCSGDTAQKLLDPGVQPCSDFHEYACGNWHVPHALRLLRTHDTLSQVRAENKLQLMSYFESAVPIGSGLPPSPSPTPATAQRRTIDFYHACLEELINGDKNISIHTYSELLHQFSRWPLLDEDFNERTANASFNWEHISGQLRRYGVQTFWQLRIRPNWQAAEQQIFYITPPDFDMLKPHKMADTYDDDSVFFYHRYIKYLLLDLGMRVRPAIKIATEIVDFERQLFALRSDTDSVILREPQTIAALSHDLPDLRLSEYFKTLLAEFNMSQAHMSKLMVVADKVYLSRLTKFLHTTSAETIGKWLLVQLLAHFDFHMHEDSTLMEQKEHCLQQLNTLLPGELSEVFIRLQHGEQSQSKDVLQTMQRQLGDLFDRLKVQFERLLNATHIFDDDAISKVLGLEKLRAMRLLLPQLEAPPTYPPTVPPVSDNYVRNLIQLNQWHSRQEFELVLQAVAVGIAATTTTTAPKASYGPLHVNAYYRLKKNAIELPIGVLRTPFYDRCQSPAALYGGIGYMLAHELVHGFDYDGLNYDKTGNLAGNWSAKSIIQFGLKSKCYLSGRYDESNSDSEPHTTINENIADSEGLRLALEAFNMDMEATPNAPDRQERLRAFFVSFAQVWCGSGSSSSSSAAASVHASHRERVNNAVGNFDEFVEAFQCRPGSSMNPPQKCRIW